MDEDLLDTLVSVANDQLEDLTQEPNEIPEGKPKKANVLTEADLFGFETNIKTNDKNAKSVVHSGDTDSSDEEGHRNYENQKYNSCGQDLKRLLINQSQDSISASHYGGRKQRVSNWTSNSKPKQTIVKLKNEEIKSHVDVFMDPVFLMRVVNPKISSAMLKEKMEGRVAIPFANLERELLCGNLKDKDWVIGGVVINKSPPKTSQKGSQYAIWTLTDLKGDIKTVTLFMFNSAFTDLWKTLIGTVVGVLNPKVLEKRDGNKDIATLSVDSSQNVLIFGDSKDFGTCKSTKKNGEKCTAVINKSNCEFCMYHIKQEYQKCSKRSELQANFAGHGLVNLRNKVLGKNEVFYAGKSYTAVPAKKSAKLQAKDDSILQSLNDQRSSTSKRIINVKTENKRAARTFDVNPMERARDLELLKRLGGIEVESISQFSGNRSEEISLEKSKTTAIDVINKLKAKKATLEVTPLVQQLNSTGPVLQEPEKINYKEYESTQKSLNESKNSMIMGVPILSGFKKDDLIDLNKPINPKHVDRAKMNALKYIQRHGPIKKLDPNSTKKSGSKKRQLEIEPVIEVHPAKVSKLQESEFISDRFKKMMATTSKHNDLLEVHERSEREKYFDKLEIKEKMEEKMCATHKLQCKAVKCLQCKYTSFSASDFCKKEKHTLKVCRKFNEIGSKLLSRGFIQLEKRHATIYKRVKSALPRRESERRSHPLARHSDILQAVETRLSMLNMTYMRYIESGVVCFIPGKVLDETKSILDLVESNKSPPRTHQLLQELRDLSSMAIEHFDEHILPKCRDQLELRSGSPEHILKELEVVAGSITPLKKFQGVMYKDLATKQAPRILLQSSPIPNTLSSELRKVKKIAKTHKHHISYLTQNSQRLSLKLRKQNAKLRIQMAKLREQDRKLQEQNAKILEQDAALTEIKKHMEDWEQKYKDLTAELVRARDEILLKTSPSTSSLLSIQRACENSNAHVPFKTNIKPRVAHILPKGYLGMDLERKRKSTLCTELPLKRNRSPSAPTCGSFHKINKNIDVSVIQDQSYFEGSEMSKSASCSSRSLDSENNQETSPDSLKAFLFDNLLSNPLKNRNLKRKLTEDGDVPPPVKKV